MGAPAMSRRSSSTHQTKSPRGRLWRRNSDGSKRYNPKTGGFVWEWWLMMEKKHEHLVGSLVHPDFSQMTMYSIYWVPNFQTNPCCFPRLYMCSLFDQVLICILDLSSLFFFGGADLDFDPDSRDRCFNARKTRFADVNPSRFDACCW